MLPLPPPQYLVSHQSSPNHPTSILSLQKTFLLSNILYFISPHNSLQGLPQPPLLLLCNLTDHLLRSTASLNTTPSFTRPRPSTTSTCTVTLNILFNPAKWDRMYLPTAPYSDTTRLFQRCLKKTSSCPDHFHLVTVTPESQP